MERVPFHYILGQNNCHDSIKHYNEKKQMITRTLDHKHLSNIDLHSRVHEETRLRCHCQSTSLLPITKAVEAVVAFAACCKSERERDLHVENFRTVGDDADDSLLGDFDLLLCGGRGGKRRLGDDVFEPRHSLLLLLSELLIIADRAKELLLELASLFDMPLLLFSKFRLWLLSQ